MVRLEARKIAMLSWAQRVCTPTLRLGNRIVWFFKETPGHHTGLNANGQVVREDVEVVKGVVGLPRTRIAEEICKNGQQLIRVDFHMIVLVVVAYSARCKRGSSDEK